MDKNMLVNFRIVMVFMRSDIRNVENRCIVKILSQAFAGEINNQEMCGALVRSMPGWKTQLRYGEAGEYMFRENITRFVRTALSVMEGHLTANAYEAAYDVADLLHVLPDVVLQENKKQLKRYWKVYVRTYEKKWKCDVFTRYARL